MKSELSRSIAGNQGELPIETYTYRRGTCALSKIAASADKHVLFWELVFSLRSSSACSTDEPDLTQKKHYPDTVRQGWTAEIQGNYTVLEETRTKQRSTEIYDLLDRSIRRWFARDLQRRHSTFHPASVSWTRFDFLKWWKQFSHCLRRLRILVGKACRHRVRTTWVVTLAFLTIIQMQMAATWNILLQRKEA